MWKAPNPHLRRCGACAAEAGLPLSDCPWSPSSPEGREWLKGWAKATYVEREASGDIERDSAVMHAEANRQAAAWDSAYRPDPVADILGDLADDYDEWVDLDPPDPAADILAAPTVDAVADRVRMIEAGKDDDVMRRWFLEARREELRAALRKYGAP